MNIHVHIERLVLDGVPLSPEEGPVLQATIESELSRLFTEHGWRSTANDARVYRVTAEPIHVASTSDAASLGQQIASAVHGGLGQ